MTVHDSQAFQKMDVTRERISRILELREILPSFQNGFNFVNAAVVCAILESISGLYRQTRDSKTWTWIAYCESTWHASKYKVYKLDQRYILKKGCLQWHIYPPFRHTRRHRCVQAYDRTNFYSRPDTVLKSRNWLYIETHTFVLISWLFKVWANLCSIIVVFKEIQRNSHKNIDKCVSRFNAQLTENVIYLALI